MASHAAWTAALVAVSVALAGCAQKPEPTPQASVSSVSIETPASKPAGEMSEVCWRVQGLGNVPHVAIHWDTESHADEADRSFASYDAGAAYPDNTAALDPDGYDLPGRFCADVEVPATGTLYIVGHGLGPGSGTGRISTEVGLTAASPVSDYVLTTTGVPETVQAGEEFSFTLTVVGAPGTSDHIGAHYGASTSTSPSTAVYTKACIHQGDALPGTFTVKCTFTEPGTVYLRGHTRTGTSNETYRHFWAAEEAITVEGESMLFQGSATEVGKPSIVNGTGMLTSTAKSGSNATLCWTIKGTGNVPHVAIHWDDASHADAPDRSFLLYDLGASYPGNGTRAAAWGYNLTGAGTQFCTDLTMPASGDVFVVAHAIDRAAGLGKLSEELKITGTPI